MRRPRDHNELTISSLKDQEARVTFLQGWLTWLRNLVVGLGLVASGLAAVLAFQVGMRLMQVPNLSFLQDYNPVQTIQIYDRNDNLVVSLQGVERRIIVPLSAVSRPMKAALLAAEDRRFYEHKGVSVVSIFRALLANLTHGRVVEGGSTITEQLAKNLFFEGEKRCLDLKLSELIIAMAIESRFSKDKILELYLNEVFFGNNSYGIEEAALTYFGRRASQLDLAQSAFLSGIIRAPSRGGALENRRAALRRQREVLEKMQEYGFVSEAEKNMALQESLVFDRVEQAPAKMKISRYPYYVSAVLDFLRGKYNAASVERQGLKIYTNLDPIAQDTAERVLAQGLSRAPFGVNQGALVTVRLADGAVLALVGGTGDYEQNQWNCATNPHTAGSAFKPFVYLAAFEKKLIEEYSTVDDTPFSIQDAGGREYKPKNYDGKFLGGITVAKAFAYSRNIPALRIGQAAGIDLITNVAERAGISEPLAAEISLCLGCSAVSPLHLANAYATLARGGIFMTPLMVRRVETRTGRLLESFSGQTVYAFDRDTVAHVVDLMQDCVAEGTGQLARLSDRPVAGKTGTADQGKDLWFVGFTPDLVCAVWGGNKDNKSVGGSVTGGTVMARIWHDYMQTYYKKVPTPAGILRASNRPPQDLGTDKPMEEKPPAASPPPADRSAHPARQALPGRSRRQYDYRSAPAGGAVVRTDRGVKEYSWTQK
jgi:penicillin-binding protein 1A